MCEMTLNDMEIVFKVSPPIRRFLSIGGFHRSISSNIYCDKNVEFLALDTDKIESITITVPKGWVDDFLRIINANEMKALELDGFKIKILRAAYGTGRLAPY